MTINFESIYSWLNEHDVFQPDGNERRTRTAHDPNATESLRLADQPHAAEAFLDGSRLGEVMQEMNAEFEATIKRRKLTN